MIIRIPKDDKPFFLMWDLVNKQPVEDAVLVPADQLVQYLKINYPEWLPGIKTHLANLEHHGTSHANSGSTLEKVLSISYDRKFGGNYTIESIIERYTAKTESEEIEKVVEKKRVRKKPVAKKPSSE